MPWETLYDLSVSFAIVTGTGAGLLSLLSWEIFRRSPLGQSILALSTAMSVFILYHVLLVGFQSDPLLPRTVESLAYTAIAVFVGLRILSQRRIRREARERNV